jgi:RNA polymerase sigma-70 factor, ECF subfamily
LNNPAGNGHHALNLPSVTMQWSAMTHSPAAMRTSNASEASATNDLVVRLQRAEPSAVGEAYDLHHEAVRAFAARLVGDDQIAEDLVQETFVALPNAVRRFRGESSLRSFITGVVVNHARHYVRSAARRRAALTRLAREPQRSSRSPEADTEQRRFIEALARALDTLPLDQRVAFVVCDVEGHAAIEAAQVTGAPEATMRTRLFHARKKLRAALEAEGFR